MVKTENALTCWVCRCGLQGVSDLLFRRAEFPNTFPQAYKLSTSDVDDGDEGQTEGGRHGEAAPTQKYVIDSNASIENAVDGGGGDSPSRSVARGGEGSGIGETSRIGGNMDIQKRHGGGREEGAESGTKAPHGTLREGDAEAIELEEEDHDEGGEDEDNDSKTRELLYDIQLPGAGPDNFSKARIEEFMSIPSYSTPALGCIVEGHGEEGAEML